MNRVSTLILSVILVLNAQVDRGPDDFESQLASSAARHGRETDLLNSAETHLNRLGAGAVTRVALDLRRCLADGDLHRRNGLIYGEGVERLEAEIRKLEAPAAGDTRNPLSEFEADKQQLEGRIWVLKTKAQLTAEESGELAALKEMVVDLDRALAMVAKARVSAPSARESDLSELTKLRNSFAQKLGYSSAKAAGSNRLCKAYYAVLAELGGRVPGSGAVGTASATEAANRAAADSKNRLEELEKIFADPVLLRKRLEQLEERIRSTTASLGHQPANINNSQPGPESPVGASAAAGGKENQ